MPTQAEITVLLEAWSGGEPDALARLIPLVLDDLHQLARAHFRKESARHTLQPTALIGELYLRLEGEKKLVWHNRREFFGFASRLMRNILVDHARAGRALKRGEGFVHVSIESSVGVRVDPDIDVIALAEALDRLETIDPRQRQVVELRYFTGLDVVEVAAVLEISVSTVKREWRAAKFWLADQLGRRLEEEEAKPRR